uniref:Uncharacterized protein n=1 Tax=Panagrolaimus superbus TaxID=310955 RepID=A0A914YR96_9BILA
MSEKEDMVVPRSWKYVHRESDVFLDNSDDQNTSKKFYSRIVKQHVYSKWVCYLMRKEVAIERCEYRVNAAICYNGRSSDKLRSIKTDFYINNALYTKMEDNEHMKEYLVLVGDDRIMFWKVENGDCAVISVPFRIEKVFSSEFGIIIERARVVGEEKSGEIPCTIYSLVHPFSEILPVIYKDSYGEDTWYAFSHQRMTLIPSTFDNTGKYFLGYDTEHEKHYVFALRRCTPSEKTDAAKVLTSPFVLPTGSPGSNSTASFSHIRSAVLGSNRSSQSLSARRNAHGTDTPLRRSFRNRAKPKSSKTPVPELNVSYVSSIYSCRSHEQSMLRNIRHTFRVFDLNGVETDELDVDYMFDCVWFEKWGNGIITPQNCCTPTNLTPKSILSRRDNITPTFPAVNFADKVCEENITPSPLFHKRPIQHTPVKPVSFKNDLSSKNSMEIPEEDTCDFKNAKDYSNERLLAVLDQLILRHRNRILQTTIPKEAQKEPRDEQPIAAKDYIKARKNIMKYYTRLMQKGVRSGNKSVKAFYALLLYRKELYQVVKNELKAKASGYVPSRAASRFFVTTDLSGQKYLCFLPSNESTLKMLKWNFEKDALIFLSTVTAFDAVNIPGNNMMAVLNNSAVTLYTGDNVIGTLVTKPFRHSTHELLQFIESYDKTIIVKAQNKKRLFVQNVLFDLDLISSTQIEKLFKAIFSTLPIEKSVKFYSTWYSVNRFGSLDNTVLIKKSFLLELPLMIDHFFTSLGLQVTGLTCMAFVCFFPKHSDMKFTFFYH